MSKNKTDLEISRFLAVPRARLWQAWADPKHLAQWWCPKPWQARIDRQDRRPGGVCNMTFYGPDGESEPQNGIYLAFDEGCRFATTDAVSGDLQPAGPFMIGISEVEAEEAEGIDGSRYTARARHWTEEAARQHAEMGFADGWAACADQLKALCEKE